MPAINYGWPRNPSYDERMYMTYKLCIKQFPNSILYYYSTLRIDDTEPIPNFEKIEQAVDLYIENNQINNNLNNDTLYVHLRSGDRGIVEDGFINIILNLSNKYKKIIILSGIHSDVGHLPYDESNKILIESLKKLNNVNIELNVDKPDNHLVIMRQCKNLLLHKGGFSTLGAIIFNGDNLYFTNIMNAYENTELLNHLKTKKINYTIINI